ncbi:MAG: hypothetical protein WCY79_03485 [Bacteroidales bacterium]
MLTPLTRIGYSPPFLGSMERAGAHSTLKVDRQNCAKKSNKGRLLPDKDDYFQTRMTTSNKG